MKTIFARTALAAMLLCGTAAVTLIGGTEAALAAEHLSKGVAKPLNDAIQAVTAKDWAAAKAALAEADAAASSDFDKLKIAQIKAYVALKQNDYQSATTYYEQIISSPAFGELEPKEQQETLRNALLLSGNAKHWAQVIAISERLGKLAPMDAVATANLAIAYFNEKDSVKAGETAKRSIELSKAAGKDPEQAALQILQSSQVAAGDQAGALATLEQLALYFGDKNDWNRLIENSLGTAGMTEADALYMYRLLFLSDSLPGAEDYTSAAGIADHSGYPEEAVAILNAGLAAGKINRGGRVSELLNKAQGSANQDRKALPQIERSAHAAKDGRQELALGEDYWGYGRYADAASSGQSALAKGGLKDAAYAHLLVGAALLAQGQATASLDELAKVGPGPAARTRAVQLWTLWAQRKQRAAAAPAAH